MAGGVRLLLLFIFAAALLMYDAAAQVPGFVSLNCGGKGRFVDDLGIEWAQDDQFMFGSTSQTAVRDKARPQYATLRYFPADGRKYCYTLRVMPRTRYLLRATFLYGNFDGKNTYPQFDIYLGATYWSTIVVSDVTTVEAREMIFLATDPAVSMCLFNASRGNPFISTLELRQFNGSMYANDFEEKFYLRVSARINFGADSETVVRYPDDPFDRIWEPDYFEGPYKLMNQSDGITKVSTDMPIDAGFGENPPQKVMQTSALGTEGLLSYRLNLDGFPGDGWVVGYFSEIQDLGPQETRRFRVAIPFASSLGRNSSLVNIQDDAGAKYRLYELHLMNVSLPSVMSFEFTESPNSSREPLLNAMEISKYVEITTVSPDAAVAANIISSHASAYWAQEGGDPCLPVPWSWLRCDSGKAPRIISIFLSGKNLTGNIPPDLTKLTHLEELWLDRNSFTGPIPDFSNCVDLKILHLENNELTGAVPHSLAKLRNLRELYLQNNRLTGKLPPELLHKHLVLIVSVNMNRHEGAGSSPGSSQLSEIVVALIAAAAVIGIAACACLAWSRSGGRSRSQNEPTQTQSYGQADSSPRDARVGYKRQVSSGRDSVLEASHRFSVREIEEATGGFEREIGSGGFGKVYHGRMRNGREIAVKVRSRESRRGELEFTNEVNILSRLRHENLVELLGFCQEGGRSMLVYEYMCNRDLGEHLYGESARTRTLTWMERLVIAEDAAKGILYLHTECSPPIMHRDLKSSNILLDENCRAKLADFGLSRLVGDQEASSSSSPYVSDELRGTVGYMDPEYLSLQRYTDKSEIYSFGVVLLELISGRKAVRDNSGSTTPEHICFWARPLVLKGHIEQVIDPALGDEYESDSAWKMAKTAISCVEMERQSRLSMTEVLGEIEQAIAFERGKRNRSSSTPRTRSYK